MEREKKKKKRRNNLPLRLNLLFLSVFIGFSVLVLRLGVVQIVNGQEYKTKVQATQNIKTYLNSARGKILDTNGKVLADNQAQLAIVYIRRPGTTEQTIYKLSKKLSDFITMNTSSVTTRDEKDYYTLTHYSSVTAAYNANLSASEIKKYQNDSNKLDELLRNQITQKDLSKLTTKDKQIIAIKRELDQSTNLTPHFIKKGLSSKELALIGEHLSEFNGMIETAVASKRKYPNGNYFFLGQVSDIPAEQIDTYLAKGYNRNDKVGVSNLEQQYEDVLRGIPSELDFTTKNGQPVDVPTKKEGQRGDDLQLTVNLKLQNEVGKILEKNIKDGMKIRGNNTFDTSYAIVMNPHTGAILAISGKKYDKSTGKFIDDSAGTIYNAFQMGSAVKGATETAGYATGAIPSHLYDKPIHQGTPNNFKIFKSDVGGMGWLTPETALMDSSNVFMGTIAGRMAGFGIQDKGSYYQMTMPYSQKYIKAFYKLRDVYGEYGLGVQTGVDLPYEGTGVKGELPTPKNQLGLGLITQFAIGQYDTYTPLELAQYGSTLANGGYRIAPHFLEAVHAPTKGLTQLGPTVYQYKPQILNHVDLPSKDMARIHKGFYLVTHGPYNGITTAPLLGHGANVKYKIAAKTGTAQISTTNANLYNKTLISYAPYDNPQVVVAIVCPSITSGTINLNIAQDIYKAYYDLQNPQTQTNSSKKTKH